MIIVKCPSCQTELSLDDNMRGCRVQCAVCQTEFDVAGDVSLPAPEMAPAFAGDVPDFAPKKSMKLDKSTIIAGISGIIAIISLAVAITFGIILENRTASMANFTFSESAEKTSEAIFKNWVKRNQKGTDVCAYMFQKCASEMLREYEADIDEDEDMALVRWKTKINERPFHGVYLLKKSKNGVYILVKTEIKWGDSYLDYTESEKKWIQKKTEKVNDHCKENKDFNWNVRLK